MLHILLTYTVVLWFPDISRYCISFWLTLWYSDFQISVNFVYSFDYAVVLWFPDISRCCISYWLTLLYDVTMLFEPRWRHISPFTFCIFINCTCADFYWRTIAFESCVDKLLINTVYFVIRVASSKRYMHDVIGNTAGINMHWSQRQFEQFARNVC